MSLCDGHNSHEDGWTIYYQRSRWRLKSLEFLNFLLFLRWSVKFYFRHLSCISFFLSLSNCHMALDISYKNKLSLCGHAYFVVSKTQKPMENDIFADQSFYRKGISQDLVFLIVRSNFKDLNCLMRIIRWKEFKDDPDMIFTSCKNRVKNI